MTKGHLSISDYMFSHLLEWYFFLPFVIVRNLWGPTLESVNILKPNNFHLIASIDVPHLNQLLHRMRQSGKDGV